MAEKKQIKGRQEKEGLVGATQQHLLGVITPAVWWSRALVFNVEAARG